MAALTVLYTLLARREGYLICPRASQAGSPTLSQGPLQIYRFPHYCHSRSSNLPQR